MHPTDGTTTLTTPGELTTRALEDELVGLAGHLAAAHCRWLLLLAEFDTRDGWAGPGLRSCAHWLSWRVGMNLRTAQDQLRVANALAGLPAITTAFAAGRLSYSKVRAITRIATSTTERDLLDLALAGAASHVEHVVRLTRQARTDPSHPHRELHWDYDEHGYLRIRGRLAAEHGAQLIAAINNLINTANPHPGEPDSAESLATRRADALAVLLTGQAEPSDNTQVIVHLSLDDSVEDDERAGRPPAARIAGGPALPRASAERLACTGRVRALITDRARNPLYLGRTRRLVSKTLLAALTFRDDGHCQYPGCTHTRWLQAHHIRPWHRHGTTDIHNLVLLCHRHHKLVHDHHYRVHGHGTRVHFTQSNGQPIPTAAQPTAGNITALTSLNPAMPDDPLTPTWAGERLDPTPILMRLLPELDQQAA
jgi:uncharacterized protein DUF222